MLPPKSKGSRFRFHAENGFSGIVKADSFEEAKAIMDRISLDPTLEKRGLSFNDAEVSYPLIIVNSKPV
jgi:hypothetical protein